MDIRMGRCSGFSLCYILWFVTAWRLMFGRRRSVWDKHRLHRKIIYGYHRLNGKDRHYIACPICILRGKVAKVRKCTDACGHHSEVLKLRKPDPYIRD